MKLRRGLTERPIRHRRRPAHELRVLVYHVERGGSYEEVEVECAANHTIRQKIATVVNVHGIAIQQQDAVCQSSSTHVNVLRVGSIQVHIRVHGADVSGPQRVRFALHKGKPVWPRAFAKSKQRSGARDVGGNLQILIFEDHGIE